MTKENKYTEFGRRLKEARKQTGLNQENFAKILGVKRSILSHYEIGFAFPPPVFFYRLKLDLGINLNWLITGHTEKESDSPPSHDIEPFDQNTFFYKYIGDKLKRIRNIIGLSIKQLADLVDDNSNNIRDYEAGRTSPNPGILTFFHKEYNISIDWIITGHGENPFPPKGSLLRLIQEKKSKAPPENPGA